MDKINIGDNKGWTTLHLAFTNSNTVSTVQTIKLLLYHEADVNIRNSDGWTGLHVVSRYSSTIRNDKPVL